MFKRVSINDKLKKIKKTFKCVYICVSIITFEKLRLHLKKTLHDMVGAILFFLKCKTGSMFTKYL